MPLTPPGSPKSERKTEETSPLRNSGTLFGFTPRIFQCPHNPTHFHMVDEIDGALIFATIQMSPELALLLALGQTLSAMEELGLDEVQSNEASDEESGEEEYSKEESSSEDESVDANPEASAQEKLEEESDEEEESDQQSYLRM